MVKIKRRRKPMTPEQKAAIERLAKAEKQEACTTPKHLSRGSCKTR